MGKDQKIGKLATRTQSLSFLALGTPISSKVLGPLPGSPCPLGLDGWEAGFWDDTEGGPDDG